MGDDDEFEAEKRAAMDDVQAAAEGRWDWNYDEPIHTSNQITGDEPPMSSADKLNPNLSKDSITGKVLNVSNPGDPADENVMAEIRKRQMDAVNKDIDAQILTGVKATSGTWSKKSPSPNAKRIFDEVVETCSECRALVEPVNMLSHKSWHRSITKTIDRLDEELKKLKSAPTPTVRPRPREQ